MSNTIDTSVVKSAMDHAEGLKSSNLIASLQCTHKCFEVLEKYFDKLSKDMDHSVPSR